MSIYYNFAPDVSNIFVLSYVYNCLYWYASKALGKWFLEILGNRFHEYFLVYSHWFMSIRISQMKDHSISVDKAIYDTSILAKYLYTVTVKTNKKLYKTTLTSSMIFAKDNASTSDEQVDKLTS